MGRWFLRLVCLTFLFLFMGISEPARSLSQVSQLMPFGEKFPVTGKDRMSGMAGKPTIAFDGTNFLVVYRVWEGDTPGESDIYAARIAPNGAVLDPNGIPISTVVNNDPYPGNQYIPSVAFDGTNYMVVWVEGRENPELQYELYAARVTPAGTVLDPNGVQITFTHQPQYGDYYIPIRMPSIAFDGTNYLVVWRSARDNIRGLRLTPELISLDGEAGFLINGNSSFYPYAAFDGTNYMVVWHDTRTQVGGWSVYGARVSPQGSVLDPGGFLINDTPLNQEHTTIEFDGTNYLVAWHEWPVGGEKIAGQVSAARVTPGGVVLDNPSILIYPYVVGEDRPSITYDGSEYLVSWASSSSNEHLRWVDSYGVRMSKGGVLLDAKPFPLGAASGHQWRPFTAYGAGKILVLWNEVVMRCGHCIYGQLLERQVVSQPAPVNPVISPRQVGAVSASTWISDSVGSQRWLDVWGSGVKDVYLASMDGEIYHQQGSGWQAAYQVDGGRNLHGGWSANPQNAWVVGLCWAYQRFEGGLWTSTDCKNDGSGMAIWGSQRSPLLTVGTGGYFHLYHPWGWETQKLPIDSDLWDVWGASPQDIYAVGEYGKIMHYNGSTWSQLQGISNRQALNAIWGASAQDIFIVGDFGTILHYNGSGWVEQNSGTQETLFGVWGMSGGDVYAVGMHGTILHYDGTAWVVEDSATQINLSDVWGAANYLEDYYQVWVVGDPGLILTKTIPYDFQNQFLPFLGK